MNMSPEPKPTLHAPAPVQPGPAPALPADCASIQVSYMWMYETFEARQKKLESFGSDSAWQQQVAEEHRAHERIS